MLIVHSPPQLQSYYWDFNIYLTGIPSPLCATVARGSTSNFRLSNLRSSGVMTLGGSSAALLFPLFLVVEEFPVRPCGLALEAPEFADGVDGGDWFGTFLGAGKFCFLSTASTSLW